MRRSRTLYALQGALMRSRAGRAAHIRAYLQVRWLELVCAGLWGACLGAAPWAVLEATGITSAWPPLAGVAVMTGIGALGVAAATGTVVLLVHAENTPATKVAAAKASAKPADGRQRGLTRVVRGGTSRLFWRKVMVATGYPKLITKDSQKTTYG